jgi:hypothetical protein
MSVQQRTAISTEPNIVKSTKQNFELADAPRNNGSVPRARANGRSTRQLHWVESLNNSDVNKLWSELHRIVCHHPLVRASRSAGLLVEEGSQNAYTDLTQELFVVLLSKARFQHYLDTSMTDTEIECEIGQIELTNLLTAELRKRHPESYRLARRISTLIQASANFRRFDSSGIGNEPHRRLADRVYGLSEWLDEKPRRDVHLLEQRTQMVPVRQRDTRLVGCTGDSQVVISNADLEDLIITVLETCDSPADMRTLRSLVMSRLPVMDIYLVPMSTGDDSEDGGMTFDPADGQDNPEQSLMRRAAEDEAANFVDAFLQCLHKTVRGKNKQYQRMLGILWHCYLSPEQGTQLEVAASLGVSDSLVSDYRRRIEQELRALSFVEIEEARRFEISLRERVRELVLTAAEAEVPA